VTSARPSSSAERASPRDLNVDAVPWIPYGVAAGVLGAAVVAVFILIFDLLAERAFWTPHALGRAIIFGALPPEDEPARLLYVVAYSAIHGTVFVTVGLIAAFELLGGTRIPGSTPTRRTLILAALLFATFEVIFVVYAVVMAPGAIAMLGIGRITAANALASAAMAGVLRRGVLRGRGTPPIP
jgi:hypothetical protein